MNKLFIKTLPLLLILLGMFLLFLMELPIPAGVLLLIGIVMIVERIWPEKWRNKQSNK